MKPVTITIYKWEGKFGPFKIKQKCGECSLSTKIIEDVAKELEVNVKELPWLDNWYKPIIKGGWHAPIIFVNNKLISQGDVVDRDILRSTIIKEKFKDYKIPKGTHIFTLPTCKHCKRAKKILKEKSINYIEHDLLRDTTAMRKFMSLVQGKIHPITVPQIFINGKWIKGADHLEELSSKNLL